MAKSGVGALFNGIPRAPAPSPSQPSAHSFAERPIYANRRHSDKYDDMHSHDGRLKEIGIDIPKKKNAQPGPRTNTPRTSDEDFVMKEETQENKRKYDEMNDMQDYHGQSAVDAARAVDMSDIHYAEPFAGFNFRANPYNARFGPPRYDTFHPPNRPVNRGRAFYNDPSVYGNSMPESSNVTQSLSGNTLVPSSFVSSSTSTAHPSHHEYVETFVPGSFGVAEPVYTSGVSHFTSASFGTAEPSHVGSVETVVPTAFGVADPNYFTNGHAFAPASYAESAENVDGADDQHENFKPEDTEESNSVSAALLEDSEFAASESEPERPHKIPKLNKDGGPRKPRQPRPKLLKWSDDDWKNVILGIVWACGEVGIQIPFEQAAQIVGEKCTAGALQQALLKLRGKQIDAGYSIPLLRMAWTRKNKPASPGKTNASTEPEANKTPRKKPTRFEATQSFIVTLPRAYTDQARDGLQYPYKWKKPSKTNKPANIKQDLGDTSFSYTHGGSQHVGFVPGTPPMSGPHLYYSSSTSPFGNNVGYLQGMAIGGGEYTSLLTTEGLHEVGNGWGDAADDVFGD